jgi:hypothetical protein
MNKLDFLLWNTHNNNGSKKEPFCMPDETMGQKTSVGYVQERNLP